jgi:hypothetical protein
MLMRIMRPCRTIALIGAALLVADGSAAWACPVCFGAADSPMTQGMNMAIALMLGILACVATGFVMFFVRLFKLSRANAGRELRVPQSTRLEGSY